MLANVSPAKNVAVLIDGESAPPKYITPIFHEIGRFGNLRIKRVYISRGSPNINEWSSYLNTHSISLIDNYSYANEYSSLSLDLIINAIDILHSNIVDVFCIVSGGARTYAALAQRIKEQGITVIGYSFFDGHNSYENMMAFDRYKLYGYDSELYEDIKIRSDQILVEPIEALNTFIKPIDRYSVDVAYKSVVDVNTGLAPISKFIAALRSIRREFGEVSNYGFSSPIELCRKFEKYYYLKVSEDNVTHSLVKILET